MVPRNERTNSSPSGMTIATRSPFPRRARRSGLHGGQPPHGCLKRTEAFLSVGFHEDEPSRCVPASCFTASRGRGDELRILSWRRIYCGTWAACKGARVRFPATPSRRDTKSRVRTERGTAKGAAHANAFSRQFFGFVTLLLLTVQRYTARVGSAPIRTKVTRVFITGVGVVSSIGLGRRSSSAHSPKGRAGSRTVGVLRRGGPGARVRRRGEELPRARPPHAAEARRTGRCSR